VNQPASQIRRITIRDSLMAYFKKALVSGRLKPGDKLPSETELAQSLDVGRASIREVLSALTFLGILTKKPEGTFVSDNPSELPALAILASSITTGKFSQQLYQARLAMEPGIARLAVLYCQPQDVTLLEQKLAAMKPLIGRGEYVHEDVAFHLTIATMTGNTILYQLMKTLSDLMTMQMTEKISRIAKREGLSFARALEFHHQKTIEEHTRILVAFKGMDPQGAYDAMCSHLEHWQIYSY
jgi:GntR family transcriptional repressor for pyruvate dehydrogenase complex